MKHLRAIHKKYQSLMERQVGQEVEHSQMKLPKVLEPKAYEGEDDPFERWLVSLLRWFQINQVCGPELDSELVICMAVFLQGDALMWFNGNINGMDHQWKAWLLRTVIAGLYDCFYTAPHWG
jgi:hypothetical protein